MASTSLPASAKEATTRVQRGRDLYTEHADEIRFEHGTWLIPSQHEATSVYEVTIGRRGESCECRDFEFRGEACKHILAATIAHAKTATCSGCGDRIRHRDLTEVTEDHESLTWFPGDQLCDPCLHDHGGIA
jgi:hypothetical protein